MKSRHSQSVSIFYASVILSTFFVVCFYAISLATAKEEVTYHLINVFGFYVGVYSIFLAFYLQFGPRLDLPLTPRSKIPSRASVTLFGLGTGVSLTGLRWMDYSTAMTLFWRVVGYSILLSLATGIAVSYLVRYTRDDTPIPILGTKNSDDE